MLQAPPSSTDSATSKDTIADWLNECLYGHEACGNRGLSVLPDRLIDLAPMNKGNDPRLKGLVPFSARILGEDEQAYICLSHCWGGNTPLKLTRQNLRQFKDAIPWNELPRTFKDAITITRDFGIHHLWIDSLCIIQDDEDDWITQAGKMASIYENSTVTIAATASGDGSGGCFRTTAEDDREIFMVPSQHSLDQEGLMYCRKAFRHHNQADPPLNELDRQTVPLLTRAWAYQEHLLAPRVLQYTANECIWECNTSTRCQCGRSNFSPPNVNVKMLHLQSLGLLHRDVGQGVVSKSNHSHDTLEDVPSRSHHLSLPSLFHHWTSTVIEGYTVRSITFPTDRLVALSGLAKQICEIMSTVSSEPPRYLAGLWSSDLLDGLAWMVAGSETDLDAGRKPTTVSPTWSWASVSPSSTGKRNPVHWWSRLDKSKPFADILSASCTAANGDSFGPVSDGYITLRAPAVEARIIYDTDEDYGIVTYCAEFRGQQERLWADYPLLLGGSGFVQEGETVLCLYLGTAVTKKSHFNGQYRENPFKALVLKPSNSGEGRWKRVGILDQSLGQPWYDEFEEDAQWFVGAESRTVTII